MHVKTRNSVILGFMWILMTAGLFYWQSRQFKELDEIHAVEAELSHLPDLMEEVDALKGRYEEVKQVYDSRKKVIPLNDQTAQTYAYIIEGLSQAGQMKLGIEMGGTQSSGDWGYNRYLLRQGEGQFNNIYRFIHYLENGKFLQKIYGLVLTQEERVNDVTKAIEKTIKFQMELHAYYSKFPELSTSASSEAAFIPAPPWNPFSPRFAKVVWREILPGEVNPEAAEVKAIIAGKAYVQYRNSLIALKIGDKVRGGYVLSSVDAIQGIVQFTLDEGGVIRKVEKRIQFEKK
ncbi:MAG: hypothetical protein AABZ41_04875 [Bacteroidota bacterium]